MFKYREPQKVPLGMDENMTEKFAYYIPKAETLKSFLQSQLWRNTQLQQYGDPDVEVFICRGIYTILYLWKIHLR